MTAQEFTMPAHDDAPNIGLQAESVHGDVTVYFLPPGARPEDKLRVGLNYLDGGMPRKAGELIYDVLMDGHNSSEAWFHWLLAVMSGRTLRQLSEEDITKLRSARSRLPLHRQDVWADGLRVISRLLDALDSQQPELRRLVHKELASLDPLLRERIVRHLQLFLSGPVEDEMWTISVAEARSAGSANRRADRVWRFFYPAPAAPRARQPAPIATTTRDIALTVVVTAVAASATGWLGWVVLTTGRFGPIAALLLTSGAAYLSGVHGIRWRFNVDRRRTKDAVHQPPRQRKAAPSGGFANRVDRLFTQYSGRYVPRGVDRTEWLKLTAGIRRHLRDEIVEVYRESRVSDKEIAWLIRHRVGDVKTRWTNGTLWAYRDQLRTPARTRAVVVLNCLVAVVCGLLVIAAALRQEAITGAVATVVLLATAWPTVRGWSRIVLESRRLAADQQEYDQRMADSWAAHERWKRKLADKPTDAEMAAWLDCDSRLLIDKAMEHYNLRPTDVIAYALIEAPAKPYVKRGRVRNGPWRYGRYELLVFLLTPDGVRQVSAQLDFEQASFHNLRRANYRFEAVAAVRVAESDNHARTFELALVNGELTTVKVTEASTDKLQDGENPQALSEAALDASGLTTTLHVLEGVAAEGKEWLQRERQRGRKREENFLSAMRDLFG
ncbi:hypothetical protein O7606_12510 [Micromonospora sp. WMMD882]|uniref:hypothetical protein n=1 Tax=Micromonospora sp. WMMD882 TaxID=3015151 RepID=UPI00248C6487|nr:hypothetical protein [Micromonospora sp. WMMD882]WBB82112.1 hypothetical protein O7606_12510 [Micromonospora sp. WMMD882]